jgi:hypothetical protein
MRAGQMTGLAGSDTLPAPLVLGRYRLHRRLGSGGFGTVWMARDEHLDRDVAVKILPLERVNGGRFEREARAAARLAHPGIVTLYEAAADDEGAYLVSELVRGATLARALGAGRLSDRAVLDIALALCDALEHAHAQGVVHRDVKPSNILLPARPGTPPQVAKLTDFGVARVLGGDTLTRTGELVGTAGYMAPEQAEGRPAGPPADLYSLALVTYEALTGVNPVPVGPPGGPRPRRLAVHLPALRRQRRELPRELGVAIDLALRPRASERGTLAELRDGLAAARELVADVPGIVEAPALPRAITRTLRRPDEGAEPSRGRFTAPAAAASAPKPAREAVALPARALAGVAAAGLTAWMSAHLLAPSTLPPAPLALAAGLAVIALPRLAWLGLVAAAGALAAVHGDTGTALALALAGLAPVLAMPRARSHWPLAAAAPLLGVLALAGAWPALAGRAGTPWRRAGLGAVGWAWVWVGGLLSGDALYARPPAAVPGHALWASSPPELLHHVLAPSLSAGLPAGAVVWALAALAVPALRRSSTGRAAALRAGAWALATAAATAAVLHGGAGVGAGRLVLGALAGAAIVLVGRWPRRSEHASGGASPELA